MEANARWHDLWSKSGNMNEIDNLRQENERLRSHIASYEKRDEKRQQDVDKILLTAKQGKEQAEVCKRANCSPYWSSTAVFPMVCLFVCVLYLFYAFVWNTVKNILHFL